MILTKKEAYKRFVEPYEKSSMLLEQSFARVAYEIIETIYDFNNVSLAGLLDLEMLEEVMNENTKAKVKEKEQENE